MENTLEKAEELIDKFRPHADWNNEYGSQEEKANTKHAIQCSIICVDEILSIIKYHGTDIGKHSLLHYKTVKQHLEEMK